MGTLQVVFAGVWPLVALYVGFRFLFWVCGVIYRCHKRLSMLRG